MTISTAPRTYPIALRLFHWLTAAILLAAVALVLSRDLVDDGATAKALLNAHRAIGACILFLTLARLTVRLGKATPRHPDLSPLLRLAADGAHLGLYALLLGVPLLGWSLSSAAGKPVLLAGLLPLPALLDKDRDLADTLTTWHTLGGYALMALIALHVLAALWHFAIRKDAVLHSMLPLGQRQPTN